MKDVLRVAVERQRELREELEGIDEFIRMGEDLLRNAKSRAGSNVDRHESEPHIVSESDLEADSDVEVEAEAEAEAEAETEAEAATAAPAEVAEADQAPRRFPWTGIEPAGRKTGADDQDGRTRRNVFRRDVSVAG